MVAGKMLERFAFMFARQLLMQSLSCLAFRFVQDLEAAYKYANRTLLDLLLKDQQLLARLRYVFFLNDTR
jgi:hypothetical protein